MNNEIKGKIRNNFNRAASTYDQHCSVQNTICQHSIRLLLKHRIVFNNIADFGCGTGESTFHLMKYIKFNRCYATDFAEQLLAVAQSKFPDDVKINWIHGDFDQHIKINTPLELIFCNMGLQWSVDVSKAINLWHQYLKNNGLLLFSIPMAGNFPELRANCKPTFLTHLEIIDILSINNWQLVDFEFKHLKIKFKNSFETLNSLKAVGANYSKTMHQIVQGLSTINYKQIFLNPNLNQLTYEIGIYLAKKKI